MFGIKTTTLQYNVQLGDSHDTFTSCLSFTLDASKPPFVQISEKMFHLSHITTNSSFAMKQNTDLSQNP